MNTRQEILDELRDWASPLADMPHTMPYSIPLTYFETLPENILPRIKAAEQDEAELIWTHEHPFEVPQGYFEQLPAEILDSIRQQDILAGLPAGNPLQAPLDYFDTLPAQVLAAAKKQEVKRISVRRFWTQLRWAAAAVLICGIGLGSYKIFAPVSMSALAPIANPEQALNKMESTTVHEYIQQNIDDYDVDVIIANANANTVQTLTKQLDQQEIQEYLDATGWGQAE